MLCAVLWSVQNFSVIFLSFYFSWQQAKAMSVIAINLEVHVNFCKFTLNEVKEYYEN
jgi:hypothetical protein